MRNILFFLAVIMTLPTMAQKKTVKGNLKKQTTELKIITDKRQLSPAVSDKKMSDAVLHDFMKIEVEKINEQLPEDKKNELIKTLYDQFNKEAVPSIDNARQQLEALQELKLVSMAPTVTVSVSEMEFGKNVLRGPTQFDSRIEPMTLDSTVSLQKNIISNASATGIIVEKSKLHTLTSEWMQLEVTHTLKKKYNLCENEAFANQPVIGVGTAFLVGKRLLVTAGHVLQGDLEDYVVVFGYAINKNGVFNTLVPTANILHPSKIVYTDDLVDMAVFEVKEETNIMPLKISKIAQPKINRAIYMIGYPSGLPQKVALNAEVLENHNEYFLSSLDAFQGNSGSPVFDLESHEVIGVLVSGQTDYIWNGVCNKSAVCRYPYCKGEKVMKISLLNLNDL